MEHRTTSSKRKRERSEISLQEKEKEAASTSQEAVQEEFTCDICAETKPSIMKFSNYDSCDHLFCLECIQKHIHAKIDDNIINIKCPEFDCHNPLDPHTCKPIIPKELFDRWCDLLCDLALMGFGKCHCPNEDCSVMIVDECHEEVKKSECPKCKKLFCFKCKLPWHACDEGGEVKNVNDKLFEKLVKANEWTRCPGCCFHVERIAGCNDMKCRCGTRFCYKCGKSHMPTCNVN